MPRRKWTIEENQRLRRLWIDGVPARKRADIFGVRLDVLRRQEKRLGLVDFVPLHIVYDDDPDADSTGRKVYFRSR